MIEIKLNLAEIGKTWWERQEIVSKMFLVLFLLGFDRQSYHILKAFVEDLEWTGNLDKYFYDLLSALNSLSPVGWNVLKCFLQQNISELRKMEKEINENIEKFVKNISKKPQKEI